MKLQNVKDVRKLFEVVDSCKGKVELVKIGRASCRERVLRLV